jgi:RNA polymerase sporulation-specific sigma factor
MRLQKGGYIMKEIETLVLKAKSGDKYSLEEVLNKFTPFIIKTARSIFISGMGMEDLIQEGYISVMKAVKSYDIYRNRSFIPYAVNAVKNNYFYMIRQKARYNSDISMQTSIGEGITLGDTFEDDLDIEEDYVCREDLTRLKAALDKLTYEERCEILSYFNDDGKSLKQIAEDKSIKYTTLIKRKNALVSKLKRNIKYL